MPESTPQMALSRLIMDSVWPGCTVSPCVRSSSEREVHSLPCDISPSFLSGNDPLCILEFFFCAHQHSASYFTGYILHLYFLSRLSNAGTGQGQNWTGVFVAMSNTGENVRGMGADSMSPRCRRLPEEQVSVPFGHAGYFCIVFMSTCISLLFLSSFF